MEIFDEDLDNYISNIKAKNNHKYDIFKTKNNKSENLKSNFNIDSLNKNYNNIYLKNHIEYNDLEVVNPNHKYESNKINWINNLIYTYKDKIKDLKNNKSINKKNNNKKIQKRLKSKDVKNIWLPIFENDRTKWDGNKIIEISEQYKINKITVYKWNYNKCKELNIN